MRLFLALTGEAKFLQAFRLNGCKIFVYKAQSLITIF